jgi:hypothetical protein
VALLSQSQVECLGLSLSGVESGTRWLALSVGEQSGR